MNNRASRFAGLVVLAVAVSLPGAAGADEQTQVILRIDGNVRGGKPVEFSRQDLEKLGLVEIRTKTPWHDGEQRFEGVSLDALMKSVGASGKNVQVVALNRYRTEIPMSDFERHKPILALKRDGQYMPIKDKGPLFVIYPFDSSPDLRVEGYYGRAAWQVRSMTVE